MTNRQAEQLVRQVRSYFKEKGVTDAAGFVSTTLGSQQHYVAIMRKGPPGRLTTVAKVGGPSEWLRRRAGILRSLRKGSAA